MTSKPKKSEQSRVGLRILATTDLHAHLFPYDYFADRPDDRFGLLATANLIQEARKTAKNCLLFDNGDFLQGTPLADFVAFEKQPDAQNPHPMINAMNLIGYDGGCIGNHEFNYGLPFLLDALSGANFPFVCANAVPSTDDLARRWSTFATPFQILDREVVDDNGRTFGIKVGIIGLVPPQIKTWDHPHLEGKIDAHDMVETAERYIPEMQKAGADIIVALAHTGLGKNDPDVGAENAAIGLSHLAGIDVVLAGHVHGDYAGTKGDPGSAPIVMAGFGGKHLGVVDLNLEWTSGQWNVLGNSCELRTLSKRDSLTSSNRKLSETFEPVHLETLAYIRRPIAKTSHSIHSYFSHIEPDAMLQLLSDALTKKTKEVLVGTQHENLPILSAVTPFRASNDGDVNSFTEIPQGTLFIKNFSDIYPYPNTLSVLIVTGAEILRWLERSAGQFNQIIAGKMDQPLFDHGFAPYNFDAILGLSYQIDLEQPSQMDAEGQVKSLSTMRIVDPRFQGSSLDPNQKFALATNNYRVSGGGNFLLPGAFKTQISRPEMVRDILIDFAILAENVNSHPKNSWRLRLPDNSSVTFRRPDAAASYLNCTSQPIEHMSENLFRIKSKVTMETSQRQLKANALKTIALLRT